MMVAPMAVQMVLRKVARKVDSMAVLMVGL